MRGLLAGRILAFVGITLVAMNMRSAVAALSPLVASIRGDFDMGTTAIAALGMIPPLCYGVFGVLSGRLARRWGLERTLIVALVALALGSGARALAHGSLELVLWTTVLFAGIGVGNVLLPPLVKTYFPDRIGVMTTTYVTLFAVGNVLPPLVAVPVAQLSNWRVSLGLWAIGATLAIAPWVLMWWRSRAANRAAEPLETPGVRAFHPWRSPVTWALLALFFCSGFNSYALFAWMPQLLGDVGGVSPAASGALLALYASLGFPLGMTVPILVARFNAARALVFSAVGAYAVGYGGLIFAPQLALGVWVVAAAAGTLTFATCLTLINLRTHSPEVATATSSFVQGIGYLLVAAGVLAFGVIHTLTQGWVAPLAFLFVMSLVLIPAAIVVGRGQFVDDPR
ncbi:MAG TPA: MFS transporter [Microbacteriaceae bacterium]|nr:MFS transporter [Microbacteriaceae bacterium]